MEGKVNYKDLRELKENWPTPFGLLLAIVLASFSLLALLPQDVISYAFIFILDLIVLLFWIRRRRAPQVPENKTGIHVCISSEEDEEANRIESDFIFRLRKQINSGPEEFHFLVVPQPFASEIKDTETARDYLHKTKAKFLVYGQARLRNIGGKEQHCLDLNAVLAHDPIDSATQTALSKEFGDLFPNRVHFEKENDLLGFEFTSDWVELVVKYILGITAEIAGDLPYSESLFLDVQNKLKNQNNDFPIFQKLQERLPIRFSEIYLAQLKGLHLCWLNEQNQEIIEEIKVVLDKIPLFEKEPDSIIFYRSFYAFVHFGDAEQAISLLKSCRRQKGLASWFLSMAFLYCFLGDLKKGCRYYRKSGTEVFEYRTLEQVEAFILWAIKAYPAQHQLYYALGLYNKFVKHDKAQASSDFKEFLSRAKDEEFPKEKLLAVQWSAEFKGSGNLKKETDRVRLD